MEKKKIIPDKVAVFDIDGTFFRSSLTIELTEELIEQGLFPPKARNVFNEEHHLWLERRGDYHNYIEKVVEAYITFIRGVKLADAMKVAERVMLFHKNRVYRYTRTLVEKYRDSHFMLAISHSPYHIVEPFAREWGFRKIYAPFLLVDKHGYFTGEIKDWEFMADKGKVFARALRKEHLTLNGSLGVGDSAPDAKFLSKVRRPIAFNPDSGLYRIARRRHWPIVVERKDVIYHI